MSNGKAKTAGAIQPAAAAPPSKPTVPPARKPPLFRPIDWLTFGVTTLLVWIGYYLTLAPNLTLEDSGELAVASFYAGIPHPPGYPIWTIYTWLWATLLPFNNIAWRVALGEATAAAVACGLLGLLVSRGSSMMIEGIAELKNIERRWENAICVVSGFVAAMLLGFNGYMWSQSVIVEVYSFGVLSLMCVMLGLMRWTYAPNQYRYLYLAFFMHGICFNNHQSLLVVALGMEVMILAVQPKLAREIFFWNVVCFVGGLVMNFSVLTGNGPVLAIYWIIGVSSAAIWIRQVIVTKKKAIEFARDLAMVCAIGYVLLMICTITSYVTVFEDSKGWLFLVNVLGIGAIGAFVHLIRKTKSLSKEWLATLACGGSWIVGTACYLYMPLAGMTNPPMQWGYPRTVEGFFHAFTRGQYEKIHPTSGTGDNAIEIAVSFTTTYAKQMWMYLEGLNDEFNLVYLLIAVVMFLYYRRMQTRERAWTLGVTAIFITLGPLLLLLLNPPPDRASRELIRVFFTASHTMVAMGVGYGLTLIAASLATQYQRYRTWCWAGGAVAMALALFSLAHTTQKFVAENSQGSPLQLFFHAIQKSFDKDQYALPIFAGLILLASTVIFTASILLKRSRAPLTVALILFATMPLYSVMTHWFENEQRGHLFGYWFGHDMFTPPFTGSDGKFGCYDPKLREEMMKDPEKAKFIYPEMTRDAILYGGTDPGRFCPTYTIFCESFIPPECKKDTDPNYDRRDVYIITQNALADGTYLNYIRAHYNRSTQKDPPFFQELLRGPASRDPQHPQYDPRTNFIARAAFALLDKPLTKLGANIEARRRAEGVYPPKEMYIATPDDSQRCFQEYLADAQLRVQHDKDFPNEMRQIRPGEDVRIIDNRVQVSGQVAVMAINGLITKVMFDRNPENEFFVEESFPLEWMYPHLTPFGVIMKINRQPLATLSDEILQRDHEFWSKYSERLIGNWITYDTSVREIADFVEKVYLRHDFSGFKGDRRFVRDDQAQKAFSKLRSSIGGVYAWRLSAMALTKNGDYRAKNKEEFDRLFKEADFTFRQAFAFCPYSPEAVFRYVQLLTQPQVNRMEDALIVAETCLKLDPYNGQVIGLVNNLREAVKRSGEIDKIRTSFQQMEDNVRKNPTNFQASFDLASAYVSMQQTDRAAAVLERMVKEPHVDPNAVLAAAKAFVQMGNWPKLEVTLDRLVKVLPEEPETWYDLAALKSSIGKPAEALPALTRALELSAKRLQKNPAASNLLVTIRTDSRFNPLRQSPEFQKLVPP